MAFGDYQFEIYLQGLSGILPSLPMSFAELEAKAQAAMSPSLWSYVAGGAGDERTQRVNRTAFERWGLMPRMFVGAKERDLSVDLFGLTLPSPVFMAPIGVMGCARRTVTGTWPRAGRRADRCADGGVDADRGSARGRRRRIRGHAGVLPALHPDGPRPRGKPRLARRDRRVQGHRRHARHLGARVAAAGPVDVELPAAAGQVPGELHQRPRVPCRVAAPPEENPRPRS